MKRIDDNTGAHETRIKPMSLTALERKYIENEGQLPLFPENKHKPKLKSHLSRNHKGL